MYDIPGQEDVISVKITRPAVLEEAKPLLRRRPVDAKAA
jgi:ATP-dependent protease Clp ATPase subunit